MAAGAWTFTDAGRKKLLDGTFDLDTDTFLCALFLSTSNIGAASTTYAGLTNEHANANGYTTGGVAITPTWAQAAGTATFDAADLAPGWTASGGSIIARFGVIYKNATVNTIVKPLLCVCLLDATPADVTTTVGNTLSVTFNASGIFTLSGAATD